MCFHAVVKTFVNGNGFAVEKYIQYGCECKHLYYCETIEMWHMWYMFFTQSSQKLLQHDRIHTGEKPCKCDTCDAQFSQSSKWKNHVCIHTGEKPYKCDTCGAQFSQIFNLKKHVRIHTGHKPYQCDSCDAKFLESGNLKNHVRTYTGKKPSNVIPVVHNSPKMVI